MDRSIIKNKIISYFRQQITLWVDSPRRPNIQMGFLLELFQPEIHLLPNCRQNDVLSVAREVVQEFMNIGALYPGERGQVHGSDFYPWITITEYGRELFVTEDWLPYDPEGYLNALVEKVPEIDSVTRVYIGESVAAFNRRHLLSATITIGVASENLILSLIDAYEKWLTGQRKSRFQKRIQDKRIYRQYKEFRAEFCKDINSLPKDLQGDWETYLDGIFNFIRLNRNDAGHPTGKELGAKVIYANLQIFADYARYICSIIKFLQ